MSSRVLVIGNKNYSSWSLRPWLAMKVAGLAFDEQRIALYEPGSRERILAYSPAGKVPCLVDGNMRVWDSLAICEYLAEQQPDLWPASTAARAVARSVSAEMHSGFQDLRTQMGMNVRKRYPGRGRTPGSLADIARITALWTECRASFGAGGAYLFGSFSIADAMYAPVVLRFCTYDVALPPVCRAYADAILALPAMQAWTADAAQETEVIAQFELNG